MMDEHCRWSEGRYSFVAVKAVHSDPTALGFIFFDGARSYYISGDTLYSDKVIKSVLAVCPDGVDVAFVPINGVGNNMNAQDAEALCRALNAKISVPLHFGMFDTLDPHIFTLDNAVYPTLYSEIKL
jgi:L-ascorbate metabolism protein UlaG (beta-lactamase superfamily)